MPWRVMQLRGNEVLARCDETGQLEVQGGRVEIRYGRRSPKAYRASASNLEAAGETIHGDEYVIAADGAGTSRTGKAGSAKKTSSKKASAGPPPIRPKADEVIAYCDGACSGNPGPAGLGVVMRWDDQGKTLSEYLGKGTNNIAELTAILRVVQAVPEPTRPVQIYTDSSYAIGLLTKGWKAKKNTELVAELRAAVAELPRVDFHHVRGHAGIPLNEAADSLAVTAVQTQSTSGWKPEPPASS